MIEERTIDGGARVQSCLLMGLISVPYFDISKCETFKEDIALTRRYPEGHGSNVLAVLIISQNQVHLFCMYDRDI